MLQLAQDMGHFLAEEQGLAGVVRGSKIDIFKISQIWWDFEEGHCLAKKSTKGGPNCWIQPRGAKLRVARPVGPHHGPKMALGVGACGGP